MNRAYRNYCRRMGAAMLQRPVFTAPTLTNEELLAVYQTAKSTDLDIGTPLCRCSRNGFRNSRPSSMPTRAELPRSSTTGWSPGLSRLLEQPRSTRSALWRTA